MAKHPEALQALLAARYETIDYAKVHKSEAVAAMAATIGVKPSIVGMVFDDMVPQYPSTGRFEPAMLEDMINAIAFAHENLDVTGTI